MKRLWCTLCLSLFAFLLLSDTGRAAEGEFYSVIQEVLPIMDAPGAPYKRLDKEIEYNDHVLGVVVYGNRLLLKASPKEGWGEMLSPEDATVLGYIEMVGVNPFPDYRASAPTHYMALKNNPTLRLYPDKAPQYNLSTYDYALLKGEVLTSVGEKEGQLLFAFDTDFSSGDGGVGARYAWGDKKDFVALDAYNPNSRILDPKRIPNTIRKEGTATLSERITARLSKHGFAIDPQPVFLESLNVDDMADSYQMTGDYEVDFITTDIYLHAYHLIFSHMLQQYERDFLRPTLANSMEKAVTKLHNLNSEIGGKIDPEVYQTALDLFSVTLALLAEKPESLHLSPRATEELHRVLAAQGQIESRITGQKIDYTLFKPRGHYTLSPEQQRTFRAISYIGLAELPLFDEEKQPLTQNLATAALISLILDQQGESWKRFEAPIDFLIGSPNTGDPKLFREQVVRAMGSGSTTQSFLNLSDPQKIQTLAQNIAEKIKGPLLQGAIGIDHEGDDFENRLPVFRISGKRFVYDAAILNRLTSPRVGTDLKPRNLPEGTDVMAVLGSSAAAQWAAKNYPIKGYQQNLNELTRTASEDLSKQHSVYAKWLTLFTAGFQDSGSDQFFYSTPAWRLKKLSTQLASWAELKHDTVLYGEQSAAEMGGGGDLYAGRFAPPQPRGYVEPDPQFFSTLLESVTQLRNFIKKYDMEPPVPKDDWQASIASYARKLERFSELIQKAETIARKEVKNAPLSAEDYANIKELARGFVGEILLPGTGILLGDQVQDQLKMALVSDVATDGLNGIALHAATGTPRTIYVFVNDKQGGARLARGYVYSYYEFARPLSAGRLTDEEWKEAVYDPQRTHELESLHPDWYRELVE